MRNLLYGTTRRVARGAAYLDGEDPTWFERVDWVNLDLGDGGLCVLGQLYGHFTWAPFHAWENAVRFGFDRSQRWPVRESYGALTRAWVAEIDTRRRRADLDRSGRRAAAFVDRLWQREIKAEEVT